MWAGPPFRGGFLYADWLPVSQGRGYYLLIGKASSALSVLAEPLSERAKPLSFLPCSRCRPPAANFLPGSFSSFLLSRLPFPPLHPFYLGISSGSRPTAPKVLLTCIAACPCRGLRLGARLGWGEHICLQTCLLRPHTF